MIRALAGNKVPKQWDVRESRPTGVTFWVSIAEEAAENTGFALSANVVLIFALADDGLLNTADGTVPVTDETSIETFILPRGQDAPPRVMSAFTPTSMYWNCVFTRGVDAGEFPA